MAESFQKSNSGEQENSLQALLAAIDGENARELAQDTALLKERAARNIKKREPYIAFLLGNDELALPIGAIQEIGYLPAVTPLPNIPRWIRGIVQIRGEILSVLDCRMLFGIREGGRQPRPSYILFKKRELKFCLMVDRIIGVVNLDEQGDSLLPFSAEHSARLSQLAPFFRGVYTVDKRTVHILDDEKLGSSSLILKWQ